MALTTTTSVPSLLPGAPILRTLHLFLDASALRWLCAHKLRVPRVNRWTSRPSSRANHPRLFELIKLRELEIPTDRPALAEPLRQGMPTFFHARARDVPPDPVGDV